MNGMLLGENGDLMIKNGSIAIGNSDEQNIELVIVSHKGEFKENPVLGVGIVNYLHSSGRELEMLRQIKIQLGLIGYNAVKVAIDNGKLLIEN